MNYDKKDRRMNFFTHFTEIQIAQRSRWVAVKGRSIGGIQGYRRWSLCQKENSSANQSFPFELSVFVEVN
jgi:hypothetical protein